MGPCHRPDVVCHDVLPHGSPYSLARSHNRHVRRRLATSSAPTAAVSLAVRRKRPWSSRADRCVRSDVMPNPRLQDGRLCRAGSRTSCGLSAYPVTAPPVHTHTYSRTLARTRALTQTHTRTHTPAPAAVRVRIRCPRRPSTSPRGSGARCTPDPWRCSGLQFQQARGQHIVNCCYPKEQRGIWGSSCARSCN